MSNWSIRQRLIGATAVITLTCVALFQLVWVPRVTNVLVQAETREVHRQADVLIDALMPFILSNQTAAVYETLDTIATRHDNWVRIVLERSDGRQIYPLFDAPAVQGPDIIELSHDIELRGEVWGRLDASVDLSGPVAILHSELRSLAIAAILAVLLAVGGTAFLVDRLITRRVVQLAAAAERLGAGQYDAELPKPSEDEIGRLSGSFAAMRGQIVHNMSNLEVARKQAESALEAKSRFLASMSHELRTPLNGIIPAAEILKDTPLEPEQLKMVETITQSSRSLLTIVSDILDLTQVEEGQFEPRRMHFSAAGVVEGVAQMLEPTAREKGLLLDWQVDPLTSHYMGDEDRIRQILVNLAGNAIKFTETGHVTIRCLQLVRTQEWSKLRFDVQDTGPGIEEADQKRIFERFEQADGGLTRRFGGSGLGLAITKNLVAALGGEISVSSTPGKGSTFSFWLPLENAKAPAAAAPGISATTAPAAPAPHKAAAPLEILLADDNQINLDVTGAILEKLGHHVRTAADGQQALDAVTQADFDLVLMDVHMPRMDGLEATRRIRALPSRKAGTRIIALTASVLQEDVSRCLEAGMDEVLTKPVTIETVIQSLNKPPARIPA